MKVDNTGKLRCIGKLPTALFRAFHYLCFPEHTVAHFIDVCFSQLKIIVLIKK